MNIDGIEIKFIGNIVTVGRLDIIVNSIPRDSDESWLCMYVYRDVVCIKEFDTSLEDAVQYCINLQKGDLK